MSTPYQQRYKAATEIISVEADQMAAGLTRVADRLDGDQFNRKELDWTRRGCEWMGVDPAAMGDLPTEEADMIPYQERIATAVREFAEHLRVQATILNRQAYEIDNGLIDGLWPDEVKPKLRVWMQEALESQTQEGQT